MVQPCGFRLCVELWEARSTDQMLPPENTPPNLRVDLFSFSFIFFFNSFSAARRLTLNSGLYTASGSVCGLQTLVTKKGKKNPTSSFPCACLEDVYSERSLVHAVIFQYEVKTDGGPSPRFKAVKLHRLHHD